MIHAQKNDDDTAWKHGWSSDVLNFTTLAIGIDENPIVQMWGIPPRNVQETLWKMLAINKNSTASVRLVKD